jgi:cytochrome c5
VKHALVIAAIVGGLGACRVTPPRATAADASRANVQLAELVDGRKIMVTKCGNCHAPPMPSQHSAAEWPGKLDEMAGRANLDGHQRYLVQQYFVVMATR